MNDFLHIAIFGLVYLFVSDKCVKESMPSFIDYTKIMLLYSIVVKLS